MPSAPDQRRKNKKMIYLLWKHEEIKDAEKPFHVNFITCDQLPVKNVQLLFWKHLKLLLHFKV